VIHDGKMLVYGGYYINTGTLGDLHSVDLSMISSTFEELEIVGDDPGDRQSHSSVLYRKQKIIFGGKVNSFDSCNLVHSLDLNTLVWK
jgi:hypothetical protein